MNILISLLKHHPLEIFCELTIAFTSSATLLPLPGGSVAVVMVFIPALMAICITALTEGKAGVRSLLGKLVRWRIGLKWVIMALGLALLMRLTMSLLALGMGMISTIQLRPGGPESYVLLAVVFFVFAIPEELGWRGYALPTLLALVGGSVLFTWLYVNNNGNILLTTVFHAAQSFFVVFNHGITLEHQMWLMAGVYLGFALIVIIITGSSLTRKPVVRISHVGEATRTSQSLAQK